MSRIDALLGCLDGIKEAGTGRWMARCPAHEDRTASLAVREMSDGRILMHCFAECDTESVLGAMGLQFSDLYPESLPDRHYRRAAGALAPREVLEVCGHELTVATLILAQIIDSKEITEADWTRLAQAHARFTRARDHGR
jgi:hypothetical protein